MKRCAPPALLLILSLILAACAPGEPQETPSPPATATAGINQEPAATTVEPQEETSIPAETAEAPIELSISLYIIDDESSQLSSGRSAEQLGQIYERVNDIWSQAGIVLDVQTIQRITLPAAVVEAIAAGEFQPFMDGAGRDFDVPEPSLLNGFYAREIGGPNGIVPFGARLFFVNDEPSVHHERVSSHEIGHILGLHHTLAGRERLLFPGTNGQNLTEEERVVARYVAQGFLDRLR